MSRLFEPPEGQQVFTRVFAPGPSDIDDNGHVNNVVYLSWAQDMAIAHWAARHTWVAREAEGPRCDRYVRIDGPDGAMCAQVRTTWCLIEREGGRPRRVPPEMVTRFIDPVPTTED